jgi:multidrug efflux pump
VARPLPGTRPAEPALLNLDSNYRETKPEVRVDIDRRKAAELGVSIQAVGRTIETMLGSREVGTYVEAGDEYKILLQAREVDRSTPYDLQNIFVRTSNGGNLGLIAGAGSSQGGLVPLSNVVRLSERARPQSLAREDRVRAITISASLAPATRWARRWASWRAWRGRSCRRGADQLPRPEPGVQGSSGALYVTFALRCWWCSWCWPRSSRASSTPSSSCSRRRWRSPAAARAAPDRQRSTCSARSA